MAACLVVLELYELASYIKSVLSIREDGRNDLIKQWIKAPLTVQLKTLGDILVLAQTNSLPSGG